MPEKPVIPFDAIEGRAVEFITPYEVITGRRNGGGFGYKEKSCRANNEKES